MSSSDTWLRNAGASARIAADRGDLWLPGALGALTYLAWLPLVLTVAAAPRQSDLAFLGSGFGEVVPYVVMIIVLLVRPQGLLGSKEAVRV